MNIFILITFIFIFKTSYQSDENVAKLILLDYLAGLLWFERMNK